MMRNGALELSVSVTGRKFYLGHDLRISLDALLVDQSDQCVCAIPHPHSRGILQRTILYSSIREVIGKWLKIWLLKRGRD